MAFTMRWLHHNENSLLIKAGSVLVPAKRFQEIVKKLPETILVKSLPKFHVGIESGGISLSINGLNPEEYPELPDFEAAQSIQLKKSEIIQLIKQTAYAAATVMS